MVASCWKFKPQAACLKSLQVVPCHRIMSRGHADMLYYVLKFLSEASYTWRTHWSCGCDATSLVRMHCPIQFLDVLLTGIDALLLSHAQKTMKHPEVCGL